MAAADDDLRRMTTLEKLSRRAFLSRSSATGIATTATAITAASRGCRG